MYSSNAYHILVHIHIAMQCNFDIIIFAVLFQSNNQTADSRQEQLLQRSYWLVVASL